MCRTTLRRLVAPTLPAQGRRRGVHANHASPSQLPPTPIARRREAFMHKYAHSAAQLAERMGAFREKELGMRDAFRKHVER